MVRSLLVTSLILLSFNSSADFLGFSNEEGRKSKIPELVERLQKLEMDNNPVYEDAFNQTVKSIETSVEEEKAYCSGELADSSGVVISKEKKQLCFRSLKSNYLEATEVIFNLKKKYLGLIHKKQIEKLTEIQSKVKADIDKSF